MYEFEKVLLKPNIEPMDSNTQRIRRNLMVTSVVAFFFLIGSSGIDSESSSFAGIKFIDLQVESIQVLLFFALLYFLIHFIWASIDHLSENRLRLTGVAIPMVRGVSAFASSHTLEPNTGESRQSTMHSWWKGQINLSVDYKNLLKELKGKVAADQHEPAINGISTRIEELEHKASYINEALLRYERGFWHYQRSQLLRWTLLDFGLPFIIGISILVFIFIKLLPLATAYVSA